MKQLLIVIARIVAFPFLLGILIVHVVFNALQFTIYGGEWITYKKEELTTIKMIYEELKKDKQGGKGGTNP